MENSKQIAEQLYGSSNHSKFETQIIKTNGGNYIYRHVLSGNSKREARIYNPVTGEDRWATDPNFFHYLAAKCGVNYTTKEGLLTGKQVNN